MTIEQGKTYALSPRVKRITAPNPGKMTGYGTNTYLVGTDEIAVIDPGPEIDSHIDAILSEGKDRIRWVAVTHTHPDHSPAARAIIDATGAEAVGSILSPDDGHQDISFQVNQNIRQGEQISGPDFTLEAVFTPGHVGNHFCYFLREEGMLFAGDHLMEGISVVIIPPSGDLKAYVDSLERLKAYDLTAIAPAHGHIMTDPFGEIEGLIRHRRYREQKVMTALEKAGPASLQDLVAFAYDDVEEGLHKIAVYSLWAHLLKLEREGVASRTIKNHWAFGEEHWALAGP
jgi:glyoxylase-like metal-dependent hydrolase (beta-lactamase superfamily II)